MFLSSRWSIILCYRRFSVNFCAKDRTDIRFAEDRETIGNMKSLLSVKTAAVVKETDFGPRHNLNVKENRFQMKTTKKKMGKRAVPGGYIENISLSEMKCVPEDKERNSKRKER